MQTLVIRHIEGSAPDHFFIQRTDGKTSDPVEVHPPAAWPVEGQQDGLSRELTWYLETFLDYPFPPWTERAERVQAAVRSWGRAAFNALFGNGRARDFYRDAARSGLEQLRFQVRSDDPRILAWPWEALEDEEAALLAISGHIERALEQVADPPSLPSGLPRDRVNILLVIARPYTRDVGFRSIAKPLVERIAKEGLPAHVTVLRPPTFENLQRVLAASPGTFHLLHFDGHGGYGPDASPGPGGDVHRLHAQGRLVFETDDGKPEEVSAEKLGNLLREHRLPTAVLNACQSAKVDERAADPFASVAAALIKGGVRSVVAMGWSLYVSGAQHFLPAFYENLFTTGDVAAAARAGRKRMFEKANRVCARGEFPLSDWLVPVVYQQEALDLSFAASAVRRAEQAGNAVLPREASDEENPYGFVGRDGALLELERAMRRPPAGILVHGLGGIGKTTLIRGFLHWLSQSGGLGLDVFWFTFNDIRSAEYVINRLAERLFGPNALTAPMEDKIDAVARALREHLFVVVWDNFESARGIEGSPERGLLPAEDLAWLKRFLEKLRGGKTKVLITSRGEETWLGPTNRSKMNLGGLHGEERWNFCNTILRDLGKTADRMDPNMVALMDTLEGHPLMMRMVLPRLEAMGAGEILKALRENLAALRLDGDSLYAKVVATLRFVEAGMPEALRSLLVPLGLHERFAMLGDIVAMGESVPGAWTSEQVEQFFGILESAGLVSQHGGGIYALHPALTGLLQTVEDGDREAWERAFTERMAMVADFFAPKPLHEQRVVFFLHHANFHRALGFAEAHGMQVATAALTQALARYALNTRDFTEAERLFKALAELPATHDTERHQAAVYHQLGRVAQERRDFEAAERWYLQSLAINEKQGNELGAASTYQQLGRVAQERRDFEAAERWNLKSLAILEKQGNEHGAAGSYHQLGMVAQGRRDFEAAEKWYLKSLAILEKQGKEDDAAGAYHQLGRVAQERRDFEAAEKWYLKSLAIEEKQSNEHGAAISYHQLGRVAEERRGFEAAERWYLKSLAIEEKQGNEHGAAGTYHQLGIVAQKRRDFESAEKWYLKALAIEEKQGNEHGAARTYHQLGTVAQLRRDFEAAERWYLKSLAIKEKQGDEHSAASTYHQLGTVAHEQGDVEEAEKWYLKSLAIEEKLGDEHGAAITYYQLGDLAMLRGDVEHSASRLLQAAQAFTRTRDPASVDFASRSFVQLLTGISGELRSRFRARWTDAGLPPLPDTDS